MKITFFVSGLSGGGTERVVCNLANYLVRKGHEVDIITIGDDDAYNLEKEVHRVTLLYNKSKKGSFIDNLHRLIIFLLYILKNRNRDVYVTMLSFPILFLLKFRRLIRGKIIASERAYPGAESTEIQSKLKKNAAKADAWVFQTKENRDWYEGCIKGVKAIVIPNAINAEFVKPAYTGKRVPLIVTAGRMSVQKNQILLLKAFQQISLNHPDIKLVIYGDGPKRQILEDFIIEANLDEKVKCPGFVKEWADKSKDAMLFVLTSNYEGIPNALIEAMALGIPCISTDCLGGGARLLIENGENGSLVPCNDVDKLVKAIGEMVDNPKRAEQMGAKGQQVCERFASDSIYHQWELFIKNVVGV